VTERATQVIEPSIRVLIVDDHAIVRKGIRALLSEAVGFEVVGEADDGQAAVVSARETNPDVILMDLLMPGMDGIEATRLITGHLPEARILVLTSFAADNKVFPAIKAGAAGYMLKDSSADELVRAIRQVHRGETPLHPTIARKLLQEVARPTELLPSPEALTAREMAVLRLIAQGLSNQQIAGRISVSEPTVRTHVSRILAKLHLASRTQAALFAVREGLVDTDAAGTQEEQV
jgi:two-component system, NarL family, response regulator LiaR